MTDRPLRAIVYVRLSSYRSEDASTSPERQREACTAYALAKGWQVVEVVEDLDVSGSDAGLRLDRPGLLRVREALPVVDVVIFAKLDRLARNVADFTAFASEARGHEVALVSVAESLDLSTPSGRFVATILAAFAEMEAATISERHAQGKARARAAGRWVGGRAPFGTTVEERRGEGKYLVPDPDTSPVARDVVGRFLTGESYTGLVKWLNGAGITTTGGKRWTPQVLRYWLGAESMRGALLEAPERDALDAEMKARAEQRGPSRPGGSASALLSGVLRCAVCGRYVYNTASSGRGRYYRCASATHGEACPPKGASGRPGYVPAEAADATVTAWWLDVYGPLHVPVRVVPVEVWDRQVSAARATIAALQADLALANRADRVRILPELDRAEDDLAELLAEGPSRAVPYTESDDTYADRWAAGDVHQRRALLQQTIGGRIELRGVDHGVEDRVVLPDVE